MVQRPTPKPVVWLVLCQTCGSYSTVGGKRCGSCLNDAVYLTGTDAEEAFAVIQALKRLSGAGYPVREMVIEMAFQHLAACAVD